MRSLATALLALLLACDYGVASESIGGGDDRDPNNDGLSETCSLDEDCVLIASSCCSCPSFAAPIGSGFDEVCEDVNCPAAPECTPAVAACDEGQCVLACVPLVTDKSCANGFAVDDLGCTLDECVLDGAAECEIASDCVQAPADCCGCENGGKDTAIAVGSEAQHQAELDCTGPTSCPGVNTCDDGAEVACVGGTCRFFGPPDGNVDAPPALCGTNENAPCNPGEVCILNHPDANESGLQGVGICQPAP